MSSQLVAITSVHGLIGRLFRQPSGDIAERLSSRLTVTVLAIFSGILLSTHYWGEPITCWAPAQFTKYWVDFVNHYCYVHGTYYVPLNQPLSFIEEERTKIPINYYQWVPYVFAVQALLFYLPRAVWKVLAGFCGIDLPGIIQQIERVWIDVQASETAFQDRLRKFERFAAPYLWDSMRLSRKRTNMTRLLPACYALSTAIQTSNAWLQWLWLNQFLQSPKYPLWGYNILSDLFRGVDWQVTGHFPRVTHCDFQRRRPASIQLDTVLCVLTLNLYYEKIFLFLWYWMLLVATVCSANCVFWIHALFFHGSAAALVRKYMETADTGNFEPPRPHGRGENAEQGVMDERLVDFYVKLLGTDGLFIIRQIAMNVGHLPASYLVRAMCNVASDWHPTAPHLVIQPTQMVHRSRSYSAVPVEEPAELATKIVEKGSKIV